jgi:penicillin-binding protein 2
MPLKFRDHAWFVAYAPFEDPVISVVVLVEHGGYGGAAAAPIAKKVIEKYLSLESVSPVKVAGQLE